MKSIFNFLLLTVVVIVLYFVGRGFGVISDATHQQIVEFFSGGITLGEETKQKITFEEIEARLLIDISAPVDVSQSKRLINNKGLFNLFGKSDCPDTINYKVRYRSSINTKIDLQQPFAVETTEYHFFGSNDTAFYVRFTKGIPRDLLKQILRPHTSENKILEIQEFDPPCLNLQDLSPEQQIELAQFSKKQQETFNQEKERMVNLDEFCAKTDSALVLVQKWMEQAGKKKLKPPKIKKKP